MRFLGSVGSFFSFFFPLFRTAVALIIMLVSFSTSKIPRLLSSSPPCEPQLFYRTNTPAANILHERNKPLVPGIDMSPDEFSKWNSGRLVARFLLSFLPLGEK